MLDRSWGLAGLAASAVEFMRARAAGGGNGARNARRAAARRAEKLRGKPAGAPLMQKPAAATSTAVVRKKPAGGSKNQLGLLEICAYPGSALSHEWAKRGESAVRIAHRKTGMAP